MITKVHLRLTSAHNEEALFLIPIGPAFLLAVLLCVLLSFLVLT